MWPLVMVEREILSAALAAGGHPVRAAGGIAPGASGGGRDGPVLRVVD